jgi:hypothetical protein
LSVPENKELLQRAVRESLARTAALPEAVAGGKAGVP